MLVPVPRAVAVSVPRSVAVSCPASPSAGAGVAVSVAGSPWLVAGCHSSLAAVVAVSAVTTVWHWIHLRGCLHRHIVWVVRALPVLVKLHAAPALRLPLHGRRCAAGGPGVLLLLPLLQLLLLLRARRAAWLTLLGLCTASVWDHLSRECQGN